MVGISRPFAKVSRTMIRELIASRKKEGFSQLTIRNIMAPVRGMFFQAMEDGAAHQNPAARIGKLNKQGKDEQKKKIDPLTREEIQIMLKVAGEKKYAHWYPLLLCAPRTGLRQGELVSLRVWMSTSTGVSFMCKETSPAGRSAPPKTVRTARST